MADLITNLDSAKTALVTAVGYVTNTDNNGDNNGASDQWLKSLETQDETNGEAEAKVKTLQFLDGILRSSTQKLLDKNTTELLGSVVSEIRGYQVLTERYISELGDLTVKDQTLEDEVVKQRSKLFEVLDQVQNWLLSQDGRSSPSEFDACTEQFLNFMESDSSELALTRQLFRDQTLPESDLKIDLQKLTGAWGNAISSFVEDAQDTGGNDPLEIGDPATIANFLGIHERIETLYERLGNVSLIN